MIDVVDIGFSLIILGFISMLSVLLIPDPRLLIGGGLSAMFGLLCLFKDILDTWDLSSSKEAK